MSGNLSSLKGKYAGKRIFLVGNGPSLKNTPLDLIQGEYSLAMNRINHIYNTTKWRPTFFWATTNDIQGVPEFRKDVMETINLGVTTFSWDRLEKYIGTHDNVYYLNCHLDYNHGLPDSSPLEWWSDDITKGVYKFGTSMLPAMQVILYLGFDTIYLVGSDLGYTDTFAHKILTHPTAKRIAKRLHVERLRLKFLARHNDKSHFSSSYGLAIDRKANVLNQKMLQAHHAIKTVTDHRGVKVFNASLGGTLEIYPRVNFFDVVK